MYIVIYHEHNKLNLDTKYYGPFEDEGAAYDFLCTLPALGAYPGHNVTIMKMRVLSTSRNSPHQLKENDMNKQRRKSIESLKETIAELAGKLDDLRNEVETIKDDEQEYHDNMPESLQNGDKGSNAQEAISCLEQAYDAIDSAISSLSDADDQLGSAQEY